MCNVFYKKITAYIASKIPRVGIAKPTNAIFFCTLEWTSLVLAKRSCEMHLRWIQKTSSATFNWTEFRHCNSACRGFSFWNMLWAPLPPNRLHVHMAKKKKTWTNASKQKKKKLPQKHKHVQIFNWWEVIGLAKKQGSEIYYWKAGPTWFWTLKMASKTSWRPASMKRFWNYVHVFKTRFLFFLHMVSEVCTNFVFLLFFIFPVHKHRWLSFEKYNTKNTDVIIIVKQT